MKQRQRQRIAALDLGPGIVVGSLRNGREPYLLRVALNRGEAPPRVAAALTMAAALPDSFSVLQRELESGQS